MLPTTTERVEAHSPERANRRIREGIEASMRHYAGRDPVAVVARLRDLDRQWDTWNGCSRPTPRRSP